MEETDEEKKQYGKIYPRVWTKEAHGGKYKISTGPGSRSGYDALEQRPDGSIIAVEAGYEKPATGATTNFVGNHMTQGAIDLVQNELSRLDPSASLRQARLDAARGTVRQPPKLIARGAVFLLPRGDEQDGDEEAEAKAQAEAKAKAEAQTTKGDASGGCDGQRAAIERYTWRDSPEKVVITVRVADLPGPVDPSRAALRLLPEVRDGCDDHPDRPSVTSSASSSTQSTRQQLFSLEVPPPRPAPSPSPSRPASPLIEDGERGRDENGMHDDDEADGRVDVRRRARGVASSGASTFVLSLRLAGEVDAERCECEHRCGDDPTSPPPREGGEIRVTLVKTAESTGPWNVLQAPAPRAPNQRAGLRGGGGGRGGEEGTTDRSTGKGLARQQQPDLAAIRRQLIAQREGRLAAQLPWFSGDRGQNKLAAAAADCTTSGGDGEDRGAVESLPPNGGSGKDVRDAAEAHRAAGAACTARGDHADAVVWFTRGLDLTAKQTTESSASVSRLYVSRARAQQHMGSLRDAIDDYTAALDLLLPPSKHLPDLGESGGGCSVKDDGDVTGDQTGNKDAAPLDVSGVTLARGRCRLQLEDYAGACEDFSAALRAKPSSRTASEALRDAKRLAQQHALVREREEAKRALSGSDDAHVERGFVRPGLPQFENRGKSGAAF